MLPSKSNMAVCAVLAKSFFLNQFFHLLPSQYKNADAISSQQLDEGCDSNEYNSVSSAKLNTAISELLSGSLNQSNQADHS